MGIDVNKIDNAERLMYWAQSIYTTLSGSRIFNIGGRSLILSSVLLVKKSAQARGRNAYARLIFGNKENFYFSRDDNKEDGRADFNLELLGEGVAELVVEDTPLGGNTAFVIYETLTIPKNLIISRW